MKTFDDAIAFLARYTGLIASRIPPTQAIRMARPEVKQLNDLIEMRAKIASKDPDYPLSEHALKVRPFRALGWLDTCRTRVTVDSRIEGWPVLSSKPVLRWPVPYIDAGPLEGWPRNWPNP